MNRIIQLSFRRKLLIIFIFTLLFIFVVSTVIMSLTAFNRSRKDAEIHLSLLTEQVLVNYRMVMDSTEKQIFNVYNALDIPELMQEYEELDTPDRQTVKELQYNVNQMVSESYPIDYVMILMLNKKEIHTGGKLDDGDAVSGRARRILEDNCDAARKWIRDVNGDIYLVRKVYTISPLRKVGQMIVKIDTSRLFNIGDGAEELSYSLLLFDKDKEHIVTTGSISLETQKSIIDFYNSERMSEGVMLWQNESFYYTLSTYESWSMIGTFPMAKLNDVKGSIVAIGFIIAVLGIGVGIIIVVFLTNRLSRQLNALTDSMNSMADGNIIQNVPIYSHDDIGHLAERFNNMTREIHELLNRLIEEEKEKNDAELQLLEYRYRSLQTQISPHFIYNALETVNAMAKLKGNDDISRVVLLISRYFRTNAKNMMRQYISVREEFNYLKDYADIYRHIHGEKLSVSFTCEDKASDVLVPTMIIQPILENALEYGIRVVNGKATICVSAEINAEDKLLNISVKDDGAGMSEDTLKNLFTQKNQKRNSKSGIGMYNVAERLKILYGDGARIRVDSGENGTWVKVKIPVMV